MNKIIQVSITKYMTVSNKTHTRLTLYAKYFACIRF